MTRGIKIPYDFVIERYFTPKRHQSPFVQRALPFEDVVVRYVRYAFAKMSASIGRVFFSKEVALPFLYWRLLRHGYLRSPIPWKEVEPIETVSLTLKNPSYHTYAALGWCKGAPDTA